MAQRWSFQQTVLELTGHSQAKGKCIYTQTLCASTQINSEWITDLNIKHKTRKLQDYIGENLHGRGYGNFSFKEFTYPFFKVLLFIVDPSFRPIIFFFSL